MHADRPRKLVRTKRWRTDSARVDSVEPALQRHSHNALLVYPAQKDQGLSASPSALLCPLEPTKIAEAIGCLSAPRGCSNRRAPAAPTHPTPIGGRANPRGGICERPTSVRSHESTRRRPVAHHSRTFPVPAAGLLYTTRPTVHSVFRRHIAPRDAF